MSTDDIDLDLTDPALGGVFFVVEEDLEPLVATADHVTTFIGRTNLKDCHSKDELLQRVASSLQLPASFGYNWDALADSVSDFGWLKEQRYLLLFEHADDLRQANEKDFDMLLDILEEAAEGWLNEGVPFFAFFALPEDVFNQADD